jgi:hypothetical protein
MPLSLSTESRWIERIVVLVLGLILGSTGIAKLVSGHREDYWLPVYIYYSVAVLECGLVIALLFRRWRRRASAVVFLFSLVALCAIWFFPATRPCGCGGDILVFGPRSKHVLICLLGALSTYLFFLESQKSRTPGVSRFHWWRKTF